MFIYVAVGGGRAGAGAVCLCDSRVESTTPVFLPHSDSLRERDSLREKTWEHRPSTLFSLSPP